MDPCEIKTRALELLSAGDVPELIVLDLDYTVWRCFIDSLGGPPFKYCSKSEMVLDARNWEVEFFPHVRPLLQAFKEFGKTKLALASRTEEPEWAEQVVHAFKVDDANALVDFTHAREIYPTSKERHFRELSAKLGVEFERMLFFDDERRNIHEVSRLGVCCVHVDDGLDIKSLQQGLARYRARRKQRSGSSDGSDGSDCSGGGGGGSGGRRID